MISIRCIHLKERDIEWLIKFEKEKMDSGIFPLGKKLQLVTALLKFLFSSLQAYPSVHFNI